MSTAIRRSLMFEGSSTQVLNQSGSEHLCIIVQFGSSPHASTSSQRWFGSPNVAFFRVFERRFGAFDQRDVATR